MQTPPPSGFRRVQAIHPHWSGFLLLSNSDGALMHEGLGSKGQYELIGGRLRVRWDDYPSEEFEEHMGVFMHPEASRNHLWLNGVFPVSIGGRPMLVTSAAVVLPEFDYEIRLRLNTSDLPTFQQIFVDHEYDIPGLPESARTIVDLGANIGLATVYFAMRYPGARLLSVEPEAANFSMLTANTGALGSRVQTCNAAAWTKNGKINLLTESADGRPLDSWGIQVAETPVLNETVTACYTIDALLEMADFNFVDVLKIDIEGAELDIFSIGTAAWLSRVGLIIVETHDRFRPGSENAVRRALRKRFEELPHSGENLVFRLKE